MKPSHLFRSWASLAALFCLTALLSSCAIVRPGEVGVRTTMGKLSQKVHDPGVVAVAPIFSSLTRVPTRTVNREVSLNLPSREGLNVKAEISILYHIEPNAAPKVIAEVGRDYENVMILSVFRSASADVCSKFLAKDMHSGQRSVIEQQIKSTMDSVLSERGFVIENVLMKSISLPEGLYTAIEDKLEAEQEAQRMEFELQRERLEAQRKLIEATGVRDAQKVLAEGITDELVKWRSLEVLQQISTSNNAKIILTDGKAPVLIE
jgi:regulator of protease activity HflC (stomatin/prohibitin superfamily)